MMSSSSIFRQKVSILLVYWALAVISLCSVHAFTLAPASISSSLSTPPPQLTAATTKVFVSTTDTTSNIDSATSDSTSNEDDRTPAGLLKRDRYVATNRFAVRPGKETKFEQRWATRKSRLATLPGFKYFHLMRRVTLVEDEKDDSSKVTTTVYDCGNDNDERQGNYVSFTVWEKKSDFSAWRKGEAFKEAHGGTSLVAFVTTLISSARTLQGAPKPAFYDGLLVQSMRPETIPKLVDGWRETSSAGDLSQVLDAECFIACNQFFVPPENAKAFEDRWAQRESKLKECDGFVAFMMNRRDGQQKGHGTVPISENDPTYVSTTIWRDVKAFQNWRNSLQFNKAHGGGSSSGGDKKDGDTEEKPASPPKPLWTKPPAAIFYEGTLVITTEDGA